MGARQAVLRPSAANPVWSIDGVVDRTGAARVLTCQTIGADATPEAGAIAAMDVTRVLDRLARCRGLPDRMRRDKGKAFCGKAMVAWARARGVT